MTFCEVLARSPLGDGREVIASKEVDAWTGRVSYAVMVCRGSVAYEVIRTARTTWKKKFAEVAKLHGEV